MASLSNDSPSKRTLNFLEEGNSLKTFINAIGSVQEINAPNINAESQVYFSLGINIKTQFFFYLYMNIINIKKEL